MACRNVDCSKFSLPAFRKFIATLVLEFDEQCQQIQFANEWYYFGWPLQLETLIAAQNALYDVVKILSPQKKVVLGGLSSLTPASQLLCQQGAFPNLRLGSKFLEPQGYAISGVCQLAAQLKANFNDVLFESRYDSVDLHLNGLCEYWPDYINWLQQQTDKNVIIGEYAFSEQESQSVTDCLQLLDEQLIQQAYYYPVFDLPRVAFNHSWFDKKFKPTSRFNQFQQFFQQR